MNDKRMMRGMHVVTLGTGGGPIWHPSDGGGRAGIATAILVDGGFYLVDCGHGVGRQIVEAGLKFRDLSAIFITHMHSDHTIDLNSIMVMGGLSFRGAPDAHVPVVGPGPRGCLSPVSSFAAGPPVPIFADNPTPGTTDMVELLLRAHATDLNDRARDSLAPDPSRIFEGIDIEVPEEAGFHANDNSHPAMAGFRVYQDNNVEVTGILVQHEPVAPAFAFRFDSEYGSVVISGDTARSANVARLAHGAGLLLHEVIDLERVAQGHRAARRHDFEASMSHHRRAHTTPREAAEVATKAGVGTLALHHLVPADAPMASWHEACATFDGPVMVPQDLDVITIG